MGSDIESPCKIRMSCVGGISRKLAKSAFIVFRISIAIWLRWLCSATPLGESAIVCGLKEGIHSQSSAIVVLQGCCGGSQDVRGQSGRASSKVDNIFSLHACGLQSKSREGMEWRGSESSRPRMAISQLAVSDNVIVNYLLLLAYGQNILFGLVRSVLPSGYAGFGRTSL